MFDRRIQQIFVAIEFDRIGRARLAGVIERSNVAAGAKGAFACTLDDDARHGVVEHPRCELRLHRNAHGMRQRIERLGTVERDETNRAAVLEYDLDIFAHVAMLESSAPKPMRMTERNVK